MYGGLICIVYEDDVGSIFQLPIARGEAKAQMKDSRHPHIWGKLFHNLELPLSVERSPLIKVG